MNKPIYRHLAHKSWSSYKRLVLMQRVEQMNVVPDVLPHIDPSVSTTLFFNNKKHQHGDIVLSTVSEAPPSINIQPFDKGERLVTIAVVNPDVPNVEKDGFDSHCHFLAANIKISPTETLVDSAQLDPDSQIILPWLPAYSQKGIPYQRLCLFVLEQQAPNSPTPRSDAQLNVSAIKFLGRFSKRENFSLRALVSKFHHKPVGVDLFRTRWDEGTAEVMERAGIVGSDVEFKRKKIEPLPYKRLKEERFR